MTYSQGDEFIDEVKHDLCKAESVLEEIAKRISDKPGSGFCWDSINCALAEIRDAICETSRMTSEGSHESFIPRTRKWNAAHMLGTRELERIKTIYYDYEKMYRDHIASVEVPNLAAVATVVDLVRNESNVMHPIEKNGLNGASESERLAKSDIDGIGFMLERMGCTCVEELEGYRIEWNGPGLAMYSLRIKGRFARVPEGFTDYDMGKLIAFYRQMANKELPRYADVELGKNR